MNDEQYRALQSLKIAKGQVEATIRMIEEDRYCVDVSNQILATQSLLKKADLLIIKQHLNHCVTESFNKENGNEKVDEIIILLSKVIGK